MSNIPLKSLRKASLLSQDTRVEAPFIRVSIGGFTMGVYDSKTTTENISNGYITTLKSKYPDYVQSLTVNKINGTVNQYKLDIKYPITENDDPNFFEKLLSSVSNTRKISITYGDFMLPEYIYKDEEAIITQVSNTFNIATSVIDYKIEAVSVSKLTLSGSYNFPSVYKKPSEEIMRILYDSEYKMTEVFTGMKDRSLVGSMGLIASDDEPLQIQTFTNISVLEYISNLVNYMRPIGSDKNSAIKNNIYVLTTFEDTTGVYGGPYFKVQKIQGSSTSLNQLCTYDIDIGYPTANVITEFNVKNNENWSIYYNYNKELGTSDYVKRIDNKGEVEYVYSPQLAGVNYTFKESDSTWWTRVTEYPVTATIKLKGLLKPAILMTYVKLNVWFFGHKHILSGYYIIKDQTDSISTSGYFTTLTLLRVAPDEELE